jgi:phytoene synthase
VTGAEPLAGAYQRCREIHRTHGRSYYLATRLLPAAKRRHVHALYGFTRWADDIVDATSPADDPDARAARLAEWARAFRSGLSGRPVADPLLPAVLHTIARYRMDIGDFELFLRSMEMDLTVTDYQTYEDLLGYMAGSAAAIGTMMVPILGVMPGRDAAVARESARQLGLAFQLTNFIRDVGEDLRRGRVYLPEKDLRQYGVSRECLAADVARGEASAPVRALIEYECRRARHHYAAAVPGIALLEPRSRVCIRAAYLLYGEILVEIARRRYEVLAGRATVGERRRAVLVGAALSRRGFDAVVSGWPAG